jgi:hypothetical protein
VQRVGFHMVDDDMSRELKGIKDLLALYSR